MRISLVARLVVGAHDRLHLVALADPPEPVRGLVGAGRTLQRRTLQRRTLGPTAVVTVARARTDIRGTARTLVRPCGSATPAGSSPASPRTGRRPASDSRCGDERYR